MSQAAPDIGTVTYVERSLGPFGIPVGVAKCGIENVRAVGVGRDQLPRQAIREVTATHLELTGLAYVEANPHLRRARAWDRNDQPRCLKASFSQTSVVSRTVRGTDRFQRQHAHKLSAVSATAKRTCIVGPILSTSNRACA